MNDGDDDGDDNDVYCLSRKIIIACVQSMKCYNLFIDSCPCLLYFTIASFSSLWSLVCVRNTESWIDVCSTGYRLLNASVFNVSDALFPV